MPDDERYGDWGDPWWEEPDTSGGCWWWLAWMIPAGAMAWTAWMLLMRGRP